MEKILLVSANFIKNVSNISDNISGKLIEPAIYEAQNEGLRTILQCLSPTDTSLSIQLWRVLMSKK